MPVIDYPVHPHGIRDADYRYGCWNRPDKFKETVESTEFGVVFPFRMSHECRYDRSNTDSGCSDCKHADSGHKYVSREEAQGAR